MRLMLVLLMLSTLGCASCPTPATTCQTPGETRCNNQRAEMCAPNSQWLLMMDCETLGDGWACTLTPDGHTCKKAP